MKVFIGFADIAGYASRLGALLAHAGHEVCLVDTTWHRYNPAVEQLENLHQPARAWFRAVAGLKQKNRLLYLLAAPLLFFVRQLVYLLNVHSCDAAVFVGGSSVMPGYLDRHIARLLGVRSINVFLGSTSRPHFMSGAVSGTQPISEKKTRRLAKRMQRQRRRVRAIAAACDDVIENPLCSQYHERRCIDWFRFGFPSGGEGFGDPGVTTNNNGRVRILHCPSRPEIKGTEEIRACIRKLRDAEGLPIEYTEITGMPHAEVLAQLKQCDFVIDELYSDSPMAGFASEAAWFARPAIVGGYGWGILKHLSSADVMPPSYLCTPEQLEAAVRAMIDNRAMRERLGRDAQAYCRDFLGGSAYVERMEKVLKNEVPDDWYFDPRDTTYIHGLGQSEVRLRNVLTDIERHAGMQAFCLGDRPDLEQAIRTLIDGSPGVAGS